MKKSLLLSMSLAMFLGVGVAVGAHQEAPVREAEAANATNERFEIRFTRPKDWGNVGVQIYTWNSNTDDAYLDMAELWENQYGDKVFHWMGDASSIKANIKFRQFNTWEGNQTTDLEGPTENRSYYYDNGWQSNTDMRMRIYLYDIDWQAKGTPYLHAWRGTDQSPAAFTTWPGIRMTEVEGVDGGWQRVFYADISNAATRLKFNDGDEFQTENLSFPNNANNQTFAMGSAVDPSGEWWADPNQTFAHNFYYNIMNFRNTSKDAGEDKDTGFCKEGTHYSSAKTAYTALHENGFAEAYLKEHYADALDRLVKWALANGETFNPESGSFTPVSTLIPVLDDKRYYSGMLIVLAIILATGCGVGIGLNLMSKKRKEQ